MKNFEIVGKAATPEIKKMFPTREQVGNQLFESLGIKEMEKTPLLREGMHAVNTLLSKELNELGLGNVVQISPDQWHFLSSESFDELSQRYSSNFEQVPAICDFLGNIYVNYDELEGDEMGLFHAMQHEAIHHTAASKAFLTGEMKMRPYRSGYSVTNAPRSEGKPSAQLEGFNEGMTEMINEEILNKSGGTLKNFGFKGEKFTSRIYVEHRLLISTIVDKIVVTTGEDKETVWKDFKKGYFTSEMMHLRRVERVFGKKSLRVLAQFQAMSDKDDKRNALIEDYFFTESEEERKRLSLEILGSMA